MARKLSRRFLRISLRSDLPTTATERAIGVHAYAADVERRFMAGELTDNQARALLAEGLRTELERIIALQDTADLRGDEEIDARIAELEEENKTLRHLARRNEFEALERWIAEAAERIGATAPPEVDPDMGRRSAKLKRSLCDVEIAVLEGDPVDEVAAEIVRDYSTATVQEFVHAPVTLSAALAKTKDLYPSRDMQGNLKICGDLLLARFGDIPVCAIDESMLLGLFAWAHRLPKAHGKRTNGRRRTKDEEISAADAKDAEARAEVLARPDLSTEERRHLLAEMLVPRLTLQTIKRYRDSVNRVFKAADELGVQGLTKVPGYAKVERHLKAIETDAREEWDALYMHVSKPKNRAPWSEECLAALFESPIYRGCASPHRRWKPGTAIIRDALYWVPLLLATVGTRIKELLRLGPGDLRQHNGVLCLAIAEGPAKPGKTPEATRYVPVPQVLLDLGFAEWVAEMAGSGEIMLFPEVARRADVKGSSLTDAFYRIRSEVWKHLDLQDHDEDCYALRMTLQSLLEAQGVGDGRRQALAGHKNGSTINKRYTELRMRSIKADVDRVGYRIVVGFSPSHGFPVIERCAMADDLPEAELKVTLGERGIRAVEIATADERLVAECGDLTPHELAEALPPEMAERLASEDFRRPQRGPRAELTDQLCAFTAVRVAAVHAVSRHKAVAAEVDRRLRHLTDRAPVGEGPIAAKLAVPS